MTSKRCKEGRFKGRKGRDESTPTPITQFFRKQTAPVPAVARAVADPAPIHSAPLSLRPPVNTVPRNRNETLPCLQALSAIIPAVPPLTHLDRTAFLAEFDKPPELYDNPNLSVDELWEEVLNPLLHNVFGWGDSELRVWGVGQQRLNGFRQFVEYFVRERGLSDSLFESRIARLTNALVKQQ